MPIYRYCCEKNHEAEEFCHITDIQEKIKCSTCGSWAFRQFRSGPFNTDIGHKERYSESMGVNPEQIDLAKKTFPGSEYTPDGRLIIKNRRHKLYEAKRRGYAEIE